MQLDKVIKGFSFSKEGPLDMRMDPTSDLTAKEIVNRWSERDLGELFQKYGEEPRWEKLLQAIVDARRKKPIETTTQLSQVIVRCPKKPSERQMASGDIDFSSLEHLRQ